MASKSEVGGQTARRITPWHLDKTVALQAETLLAMPTPAASKGGAVTNALAIPSYKGTTHPTYLTPLMVFDLPKQADWKSDPEILAREWGELFERKHILEYMRIQRESFGKFHALEKAGASEHWRKLVGRHFDRVTSRVRSDEEDDALKGRILTLRELAEEDDVPASIESSEFLINFVVERHLINPSVVLTNKGDFRAIWRRKDFSFEVDFLSEQRLSVLYSRNRPAGAPGRYAAVDTAQAIVDRWADIFYDLRNRD